MLINLFIQLRIGNKLISGIYSPFSNPGCKTVKNMEFSATFIREIIIRVYSTDGSVLL
jgi:hypothetical protein